MSLVDADAGPSLAAAFGRRMLAARQNAGTKYRAAARQRQLAFQTPVLTQRPLPFLFSARRQCPASDVIAMPAPPATRATPTPWAKRRPLCSFSTVITTAKPAIHPTFITPTASIT